MAVLSDMSHCHAKLYSIKQFIDDTVQARKVNELKSRLRRDWTGHPDLYYYNFSN